jgi:hypothetical protein
MKPYAYADDTYLLKDDCEYEPYGLAECALVESAPDRETAEHVIGAMLLKKLGSAEGC